MIEIKHQAYTESKFQTHKDHKSKDIETETILFNNEVAWWLKHRF